MNVACTRLDEGLPILFVDFNQDFTSIQVGTKTGYSLLSTVGDQIQETFSSSGDPMCIVGRLFNRSLVTLVSQNDMRRLLVAHSRINTLICHYRYTLTILAVKMNHQRLVVCVEDGIFIHNMRDMQLLHKVEETPPNRNGVIALSSNEGTCYLAYPGSHRVGTVFIFDALSFQNVTSIAAHDGLLAALSFNPRANLLATASEKGTVIRVFSIPQGDKVIEFRRGLTRCVNICSLTFSMNSQYLVAASHTETVHVFKLENRSSEPYPDSSMEHHLHHPSYNRHRSVSGNMRSNPNSVEDNDTIAGSDDHPPYCSQFDSGQSMASWSHGLMDWMGNTLKSYSAYLPQQVSEIFAHDRAFAYARVPNSSHLVLHRPMAVPGGGTSPCSGSSPNINQAIANDVISTQLIPNANCGPNQQAALGQRKVAALIFYQNQPRLIVASLDGFVHLFSIDPVNGGEAILLRTQRLLSPHQSSATSMNNDAANSQQLMNSANRLAETNRSTSPMNFVGSGGPQQPGVYALPASSLSTKTGTTFASVVVGSGVTMEENMSNCDQNAILEAGFVDNA